MTYSAVFEKSVVVGGAIKDTYIACDGGYFGRERVSKPQ
jgi:hypothetical protein